MEYRKIKYRQIDEFWYNIWYVVEYNKIIVGKR